MSSPWQRGSTPTEQVSAAHRSLHHLVAKAAWSDDALLAAVREQVLPALGPVTAARCASRDARACGDGAPAACWCRRVDGTGFPKKGRHPVGVARQYCGEIGKQDNCQVAVSLSVANERSGQPADRLAALPTRDWAHDPQRRAKAGVPGEIACATKPQTALARIRVALAQGVPPGVVLADAGYGADMDFQEGLLALALPYVVGRYPAAQLGLATRHGPATSQATAWRTVGWREGSRGELASRLAACRVRPGHRDHDRREPWPELWLLVEWPEGEDAPTKSWLANLPAEMLPTQLVGLAKSA